MTDAEPLPQDRPPTPLATARIPLSAAHQRSLCAALTQDFTLDNLRLLARTEFNVDLEEITTTEQPRGEVVAEFVAWALKQPLGAQGLLAAACRQNPGGPHLAALATAWADLTFDPVPPCPYPGMQPFTANQANLFFGREREIEALRQRVLKQPIVVVIGPSGSGKSSLVKAGLLPMLQQPHSPAKEWTVRVMRPGLAPNAALSAALAGVWDAEATIPSAAPLLLVVDQFEDFFAYTGPEAQPFLTRLSTLIQAPTAKLILTLRADFYEQLMESPLWPVVEQRLVPILPLDRAGLADAIVRPAAAVGVDVEPALVERLLGEGAGARGVLPFLQETLVMLWGRLTTPLLTLRDYEALTAGSADGRSGLQVAMALHADETLQHLAQQHGSRAGDLSRRLFMRLVQFGDGGVYTSRPQSESQLRAAGDDVALLHTVLSTLVDNRLLTAYAEVGNPEPRFALAHDKLIDGWPTLQGWIRELAAGEQQRRRLEDKAAEHARLGPDGGLLDIQELKEADAYARGAAGMLLGMSEAAAALIAVSRQAIDPGWNRWGLSVLGGLALSAALWLGVVYLSALTMAPSVQAAVWISVALAGTALLAGLWLAGRRRLFWLQHLTQRLGVKRLPRYALGGLMAGTLIAYAVVGMPLASQIQHCEAAPRRFERPRGNAIHVALINDDIDTYSFDVVRSELANQQRIRAWPASEAEAMECSLFFQKVVHLRAAVTSSGETAIVAEIQGETQASQPKAFGRSCFAVRQMASDVAKKIDPSANIIALDVEVSAQDSCKALSLHEDGTAALKRGDVDAAVTLFAGAIAEWPTYALGYTNLGNAYEQLGDLERAEANYRRAVELAPTEPLYLYLLANFYRDLWKRAPGDMGSFASAERMYRRTIEVAPAYAAAFSGLANLLIYQGERLDEAEQLLNYGLTLVDDPLFRPAEQRLPIESALYKNLGLLAMHKAQFAQAIELLTKADELNDASDLDILPPLAEAYAAVGDTERSCAAWGRLKELIQSISQTPAAWVQEASAACVHS